MRVTYLRLENVAGLVAGSNKDALEIDFTKSINKIIAIQAPNAHGKSVLLSSISPFAGVTSVDDRSSLSYIVPKKNGYKEIHYQDGDNKYIIKHYYKPSKDSHTIKSYFSMNREELNENGNVRSFLSLVEVHFGLTQEMMRLIRLGSNVNSFVTLTPAARKEYIGKLIEEINAYMMIYKDINDQIRVVKTLISSNNTNLYNCHISDLVVEEEKLAKLAKEIKQYEKDKDKLVAKIGNIKALMKANDIDDLKAKRREAESSLDDLNRVEAAIKSHNLEEITIDQLITKRSAIAEERIDIQSKINSYRISIDNTLKNIERLETAIKKVTSDNDVQSLVEMISSLRESINSTSKLISGFTPPKSVTSDAIQQMISMLSSFNLISQTIYTFGTKPVEVYLRLRNEKKGVDKWLKDQAKRSLSRISEDDIKSLVDQVFQNDFIITPNCDTEFEGCPYYRFATVLDSLHDKLEEESYDPETLRYIQVISNNIDNILNEIDRTRGIQIPDALRENLREKSILDRLRDKLPFFDLSEFQEYLMIIKDNEIYRQNVEKLKQFEYQLSIYKKSGIEGHMDEINQLKDSVEFYRANIATLESRISGITSQLAEIDQHIALVTRYNDGKKYRKVFESTIESTNKILGPLETAENEKNELEFSLNQMTNLINLTRQSHKELENRINEYQRLVKEGEMLSKKHRHLSIILKANSTKEGVPVLYIKRYLGRIKNLANNLLKIIYDDEFRLAKFNIDQDSFEIPYIRNGKKVPDIKYSSQSELAMSTMALSFALANQASGGYNIILLDEVEGGLDEVNRSAFLRMLYMQMAALQAEQVFMISQNLNQMVNVPMDCIRLADVGPKTRLQNVIYE